MSRLHDWKETCEWIREWEAYRYPPTALTVIKRAAKEQRANYEACVRDGRHPSCFNMPEYRRCVEAIEAAILRAEERAAKHEADCAAQEERARIAAESARATFLEKYAYFLNYGYRNR